jgi:hypothetical protein
VQNDRLRLPIAFLHSTVLHKTFFFHRFTLILHLIDYIFRPALIIVALYPRVDFIKVGPSAKSAEHIYTQKLGGKWNKISTNLQKKDGGRV